jgi:hypothetical protein
MPRLAPLALAVIASALPRAAAADETTATSSIAQLIVVEPGSKSYRLFHGAIWLEYDKQQYNYRWGGLQCKGRDLSDSSVQLLFASFRSEYSVTVEYVNSEYRGKQYRCITAFTVTKS